MGGLEAALLAGRKGIEEEEEEEEEQEESSVLGVAGGSNELRSAGAVGWAVEKAAQKTTEKEREGREQKWAEGRGGSQQQKTVDLLTEQRQQRLGDNKRKAKPTLSHRPDREEEEEEEEASVLGVAGGSDGLRSAVPASWAVEKTAQKIREKETKGREGSERENGERDMKWGEEGGWAAAGGRR